MRKFLLVCAFLLFPGIVLGQEVAPEKQAVATEKVEPREFGQARIVPKITVDRFVEVGEKILFDASDSVPLAPSVGKSVFTWDFGDGSGLRWGEKNAHQFQRPGRYTVTLRIKQGRTRESVTSEVIVFSQKAVLVADSEFDAEGLVRQAGEYGIWLDVIPFEKSETGFSAEEEFVRQLQEKIEFLRDADLMLFQAKSAAGLQNFAQWWQKVSPENRFDPREKLWIQIAEGSLDQVARLAQPSFSILRPKFILLTRHEALNTVFEAKNPADLLDQLSARALEFRILDDRASTSFFLVFSRLTTYFVSHGISQSVIYLLLAVPFIVFLIAFFRQFVGITTFGVFTPLILTLSFMLLGLQFGFLVFAVVLIVSYLIRLLFDRVELLYIPKVSLLLSALALSFFLVLGLVVYFESSINLTLAVFPMLVMSMVSEKFLSAQSVEGFRSAMFVTGETVLVSLIAYALVNWGWLESSILALPELVLLPIFGNIWLGRFTGLRLSEYFKFRALFGEDTQE